MQIPRQDRHPLVGFEKGQQRLEALGRIGPGFHRVGPCAWLIGVGVVPLREVGEDVADAEREGAEELIEDGRTEDDKRRHQDEDLEPRGQRPLGDLIFDPCRHHVLGRRDATGEGAAGAVVEDEEAVTRSVDVIVPLEHRFTVPQSEPLLDGA